MTKAKTEQVTKPITTLDANLSYWAMGKHIIASAGNALMQGTNAVGNSAEAINKLALSANNYADVAVIFSEDEKNKAMVILNESRAQLN